MDAARADAVVESTEDAFLGLIPAFKIQDLDQRAKILKEFFYDDYNEKLAKFEKMLKTNKSGPNFFVGDDVRRLFLLHLHHDSNVIISWPGRIWRFSTRWKWWKHLAKIWPWTSIICPCWKRTAIVLPITRPSRSTFPPGRRTENNRISRDVDKPHSYFLRPIKYMLLRYCDFQKELCFCISLPV